MPSQIAVAVSGVTKRYRLYASIGDRIKEMVHPFRRTYHNEFWALKGVDLEVERGECLGILGRNGAGKSTLLKVIAGIIKPTAGEVHVAGRIEAMFQLGAGFSPEQTGRENVEMQCLIADLPRAKIAAKVAEVEDFADVGAYFDQPVRTYSSGMFMRVAFAAAILTEPDILIVDEALAVGDVKFQHKCFGRILDFRRRGSTVILVTHSPDLISLHCTRGVVLHAGHIVTDDKPDQAIHHYHRILYGGPVGATTADVEPVGAVASGDLPLSNVATTNDIARTADIRLGSGVDRAHLRRGYNANEFRYGTGEASVLDCVMLCDGEVDATHVGQRKRIIFLMQIRFNADIDNPSYGIVLKTKDEVRLYGTMTEMLGQSFQPARAGDEVMVQVDVGVPLPGGAVFVDLGVARYVGGELVALDIRKSVLHFTVEFTPRWTGFCDLAATFQEVGRVARISDDADATNPVPLARQIPVS
jgi:lipopolysaccharide transport system ATP-binding protein